MGWIYITTYLTYLLLTYLHYYVCPSYPYSMPSNGRIPIAPLHMCTCIAKFPSVCWSSDRAKSSFSGCLAGEEHGQR